MNDELKSDYGSVKVHEQVIAEVVYMTLEGLEDVRPLKKNLLDQSLEILGRKVFPGIEVKIDENQETSIEAKLLVCFGKNISTTAKEVQEAVRNALQKTLEIDS